MIPIGTRSLVGRYGRRCRCKCDLSFRELTGAKGRTRGRPVAIGTPGAPSGLRRALSRSKLAETPLLMPMLPLDLSVE
jgi:hypothetical protein